MECLGLKSNAYIHWEYVPLDLVLHKHAYDQAVSVLGLWNGVAASLLAVSSCLRRLVEPVHEYWL